MKNVVMFYGVKNENCEFSNHFMCEFVVNGNRYNCVEQYMMSQKALIFRDFEIFNRIMNSKDPAEMKRLGREVKDFSSMKWNSVCEKVVKNAVRAKFEQNEKLKEKLLGSGEKLIVEVNPKDRKWGIGFGRSFKREVEEDGVVKVLGIMDVMDEWGENKLGKILMEVRDELRLLEHRA